MVFIGVILRTLFELINKKESESKAINTLRISKVAGVVGIAVYIAGFVVFLITIQDIDTNYSDTNSIFNMVVFFSFIVLLGSYLCLIYLNFRVDFDEEKFVKRNILRKKQTIYYTQITKIAYSNNTFYVFTQEKKYAITPSSIGFKDFLAKLQEKTGLLVQTI